MWAYNHLRTKHFHGVSSRNQHPYLLKSRYGKVRSYLSRTVRLFSKANPKFDFWRAKKGRFWPKLRPKRTIYTAVITAHEPPSVVTIGLPTKNNFSNFRIFNNL